MAARIVIPGKTPRLLNAARYAKNGVLPYHVVPLKLASLANFATARCHKTLFEKSLPIKNVYTANNNTWWRFRFYSGFGNSSQMVARLVAFAKGGGKFRVTLTPDGGSADAKIFIVGGNQSQLRVVNSRFTIAEDTWYSGEVAMYTGFDPCLGLTLYSDHDDALDPTDDATVDAREFRNIGPIRDEVHDTLVEHSHRLFRGNGKMLFSVAPHTETYWTRTSSTAVNIFDGSSTTVTSSTPGFNVLTDELDVRHTGTVPARFLGYGSVNGVATDQLQLHDSSGSLGAMSFSSIAGWSSVDVQLTPGNKLDVLFKSDAVNQVEIEAFGLVLYAAT